jgi:type III pantothenate kinase
MNVLAVDIGNTRIKWGHADAGGGWLRQGWVPTATPAALAAEWSSLPPPQRIVLSNVAGDGVRDQVAALLPAVGAPPLWLAAAAAQCGVRSSYAQPERLGPDRWAALIAARRIAGGACVVVNAGTTMTVDALDGDGLFLGGCIVAGATLMRQALARDTANLALREGAFAFFPDNTGDAIFSGAVNALAGAVRQCVSYLEQAGAMQPVVVLSGGDASLIEPRLGGTVLRVDNLVLEGLLCVARDPS